MIRSLNLPRLIFLQGPPQCGKDTLAKFLVDFGRYKLEKFARPIIEAMEGQFPDYFTARTTGERRTIEDFKRHNFAPFLNRYPLETMDLPEKVTGRDIMIAWSERFMKPLFGPYVFGTLAAMRLYPPHEDNQRPNGSNYVMSDSGFELEARPLFEVIGKENCAIIQIYRPGHNFNSDSRSYWADPEIATFSYNNALAGIDHLQIDFAKWFNSHVFSYKHQAEMRNPNA